jgi:hypothetical protein
MAGPETVGRVEQRRMSAGVVKVPEISVRLVAVLLALAVATVHVADQGGIRDLTSPAWIGWGYRAIEVGGILTALAILLAWPAWLGWVAGVLLGAAPFIGYVASRTVALPGDPHDVGNWGYWVGTASLVVEAALVVLSVGMLLALRQRSSGWSAPGGS